MIGGFRKMGVETWDISGWRGFGSDMSFL